MPSLFLLGLEIPIRDNHNIDFEHLENFKTISYDPISKPDQIVKMLNELSMSFPK